MLDVFQKLKNILIGHTGGNTTKELAESRLRICFGCVYNTQQHQGFGHCRACKCPLVAKTRVAAERCPKAFWIR